jgi:hypothetical protein
MASFNSLPVPTEVAAGAWLMCEGLRNKHVTVYGTFVATVQVQYTIDTDADPVNIGAAVTAAGYVSVPMEAKKVRVSTTAFTSGAPKAMLSSEG